MPRGIVSGRNEGRQEQLIPFGAVQSVAFTSGDSQTEHAHYPATLAIG